MKKILGYLNQHPTYIGFIGVLLGGVISFISLNYSKKVDLKESRKKHIEELYANFSYSFSVYKDRLITGFIDEWDMHLSEKIFSYPNTPIKSKVFYKKRFMDKYNNIHSDNMEFSESLAKFKKDYKLLNLYVDLKDFDDYFNFKLDSAISQIVIIFKIIPQSKLANYSSYQSDSLYSIFDREIKNVHEKSDSLLSVIHQKVLIELRK